VPKHTLLCQEQAVALLDGDPVPRVLVVGREAGGVRALAHFAVDDLFQRVDALGWVRRVGDVHEMHAVGWVSLRALYFRGGVVAGGAKGKLVLASRAMDECRACGPRGRGTHIAVFLFVECTVKKIGYAERMW
jgi:hypothetical protein